jgi:3-hydroxybutyryl-CoA dehydratase
MPDSATRPQRVEWLRENDAFTTPSRMVTEADITSFASLTGDSHSQHVDPQWAASSPFGERVAPGALVLSFALGLLRLDPRQPIVMTGITDVVFTRPTRIGDRITVAGRVSSRAPAASGSGATLTLTLRVVNQDGKTVCRAKVRVTEPAR